MRFILTQATRFSTVPSMFFRAITYSISMMLFFIILSSLTAEVSALEIQDDGFTRTSATHLVLKNGQVVKGQISRDANSVYVQTLSGSRVVFPVEKVEFVCSSMNEAYWQKNARVKASDLSGHVQLFHWCMKQGLLNEAENQIDLLLAMDIKASHLEYLNRQLLVALGQQKRLGEQQIANRRKKANASSERSIETPKDQVGLVGYETDASTSLEIQRLRKLKQIEEAAESLPKNSVGIFKRKIEPMLVRNCYGCHASEETNVMPLMRMGKNQVIPKRFSQRNLFSVLKYTDLNEPLASRLFAAAASPHAGLEDPILKRDSVQYTNLGLWLIQISSTPNAMHIPPDFQQISELPGANKVEKPTAAEIPSNVATPSEKVIPSNHVPNIPQLQGNPNKPQAVLDPFDADVFNRLHLKGRNKQD